MNTTITCPRCAGRDMTANVRLVSRGEYGCTIEPSTVCEMCVGAGEITAEHEERYRIGRQFHAARIDLALSLADLADTWGGSPSRWSTAERLGIGEPWMFGRMAAWLEYEGDPPEHAVRQAVDHFTATATTSPATATPSTTTTGEQER